MAGSSQGGGGGLSELSQPFLYLGCSSWRWCLASLGGKIQHLKILGQLLTHAWTGLSVLHQTDPGSACPGLERILPLCPCPLDAMTRDSQQGHTFLSPQVAPPAPPAHSSPGLSLLYP